MKEKMIEVKDFQKKYGDFIAVDNISFDVFSGEIFGLLGPNGAGKTSTLESLEGLRKPSNGSLKVCGLDPHRQNRQLTNHIGVQLQTSGLPANMTVKEAMQFFCAYHQVQAHYDLLERLGLKEKMNTQYQDLSTGQQRRLALALAIAHDPQVLFLDEPTAGLDVSSRFELHSLMHELRDQGTTIILATHDMAEAEKMADRVAILLKGKIAVEGTPTELTATGKGLTKVSVLTTENVLHQNDADIPGVVQRTIKDQYTVFFTSQTGPTVAALIQHIEKQHDILIDLRVERPSLEERFLEITENQ